LSPPGADKSPVGTWRETVGIPSRTLATEHVLPYGVFRPRGDSPRVGVASGESAIDLLVLARSRLLEEVDGAEALFAQSSLNAFMARGPDVWSACRRRLLALVGDGSLPAEALVPLAEIESLLPIEVADYVDFYSSLEHASNAGRIFRPGSDPLPPNWRHLPVGYHGRAGTVVVSGTPIVRPRGQFWSHGAPEYRPSERVDIELELGVVIGTPSEHGRPVPVDEAMRHVFGLVLLNDWSARDVQGWETVPLGPFLGKSFATSISAWVTPLEALAERRVPGPVQDPEPLEYLRTEPQVFDLELSVSVCSAGMASRGEPPQTIVHTSARNVYWSVEQQMAHLTANGASLRTGDLLGSGTISGPERTERGSLLELSWNGQEPFELDGERRTYLEDGDEVILSGELLSDVSGRIVPSH
jgi:fumarylacetoacetase